MSVESDFVSNVYESQGHRSVVSGVRVASLSGCNTNASEWRPVVGYVGLYEVSSDGQVRGLERTVLRSDGHKTHVPEHIMCSRLNGHTLGVGLWRDGVRHHHSVSQLIAAAFR